MSLSISLFELVFSVIVMRSVLFASRQATRKATRLQRLPWNCYFSDCPNVSRGLQVSASGLWRQREQLRTEDLALIWQSGL